MTSQRPGGLALWSQATLPGRPTLLVVDASRNMGGWEAEASERMFAAFQRRHLGLATPEVVRPERPDDLTPHVARHEQFNSVLFCGFGSGPGVLPDATLAAYWSWLNARLPKASKLFAACTWDRHDPAASKVVLDGGDSFAALALAPQSPLTAREGGLFFMKFFIELDLHSEHSSTVTGKMVWFGTSKAREILRRRKLSGKVGVRC